MSRAAVLKTSSIIIAVIAALGFGGWGYIANSPGHKVDVVVGTGHHISQLSYKGQNAQNALTLLKKHATVQTKHYSFGDLVTSIDGTKGTGPKYWTFYINGKEASVGAGSYTTHGTDTVMWKLQ